MKIYREINLNEFEFWSGARDRVKHLSAYELELLTSYFEDLEAEGHIWSETNINDFFWFEEEWIAKYLGFENWEELESLTPFERQKREIEVFER